MGTMAYPSTDTEKHRRSQRRTVTQYAVLALNSLASLLCFGGAVALLFGQNVVSNFNKSAAILVPEQASTTTVNGVAAVPASMVTNIPSAESTTTLAPIPFPDADPAAKNFLITGADNGGCSTPGSQFDTGDRSAVGPERSDSIMVIRVDPPTGRAAVLSFPRDLWVKIAGSNSKQRINTAYRSGDPQKLIDTIYNNFGVPIDHFIQIDFCAFKTLVDAVGGVSVPFDYPVRDPNVQLLIEEPGCHTFNGDGALAYVRSRHFERLNPDTGRWQEDPASDFGRISRQQDFLRRAMAKVLSKGPFNVDVARGLIEISKESVVLDPELTINKMLEFAGVLKNLDPSSVQTYQIEAVGRIIQENSVLEPRIASNNMQAILAIFKGQAQLAGAPEQIFLPTPDTGSATTTTTPSEPPLFGTTPPTTDPAPTTTLPAVEATEIVKGFVPAEDKTCP